MIDKTTVEVIRGALVYAAEEMGIALKKSAYSPNIKERMDHSCALFDPQRRLIAQAEHIPVHLGSMALGVREGIAALQGDTRARGHDTPQRPVHQRHPPPRPNPHRPNITRGRASSATPQTRHTTLTSAARPPAASPATPRSSTRRGSSYPRSSSLRRASSTPSSAGSSGATSGPRTSRWGIYARRLRRITRGSGASSNSWGSTARIPFIRRWRRSWTTPRGV